VLLEARLPPVRFGILIVPARVDASKDFGTMQLLRRASLAANTGTMQDHSITENGVPLVSH